MPGAKGGEAAKRHRNQMVTKQTGFATGRECGVPEAKVAQPVTANGTTRENVRLFRMPGSAFRVRMPRNAFLSVDLDYWNKASFDPWLPDTLFAGDLPRIVTLDHHDMLPAVNAQPGLTRLMNIDYHSDFIGADEPLHIGNWVNHVSWRRGAEYAWIVPRMVDYHLRLGHHHTGANPFTDPERLTGWRAAGKREGYDKDILDTVAAFGVCVSPDYLDRGSDAEAALRNLLGHLRHTGTPLVWSRKPENNAKFRERLDALGDDFNWLKAP